MTEKPVPQGKKPLLDRDGKVVLRDLAIFQIKLLLDGVKDVVLVPTSILAALLDLVWPTGTRGARFYAVMTAGEKFDNWLNLFGASTAAASHAEGLFGASRAGADSLLGRLEEIVLGHKEDDDTAPAAGTRAAEDPEAGRTSGQRSAESASHASPES
jgi:hypothetical protein